MIYLKCDDCKSNLDLDELVICGSCTSILKERIKELEAKLEEAREEIIDLAQAKDNI